MAEYIDREALLRDIENSVVFSVRNAPSAEMRGAHKITDRIRCAPAADVVEVVRCENCKIRSKGVKRAYTVYCEYFRQMMFKDDFCSFGEREE